MKRLLINETEMNYLKDFIAEPSTENILGFREMLVRNFHYLSDNTIAVLSFDDQGVVWSATGDRHSIPYGAVGLRRKAAKRKISLHVRIGDSLISTRSVIL